MSPLHASAVLGAASSSIQADLDRLLAERAQLRAILELGSSRGDPEVESALAGIDRQLGTLLERWSLAGGRVLLQGRGAPRAASPAPRQTLDGPVVTRHRRVPAPSEERSRSVDATWRLRLSELMGRLGPGQDLAGEIDIVIEAAVACEAWVRWPRHVQRHLVGLLACRLRSLQDEQGVPEYELQEGFSALTRFSKRAKPGFVFGLSRSHRPQHGRSWDDDAVRHWDHLAALGVDGIEQTGDQADVFERLAFVADELGAAPEEAYDTLRAQALRLLAETLEAGVDSRDPALIGLASALQPVPSTRPFMRLRHALRDAASPSHDEGASLDLEPDWGWWLHTRGRRGLILGAAPDDEAIARLQHAFAMSGLESRDEPAGRRLLAGGNVDVLFVFGRYMSDITANELLPLARARKIPVVHVDHGSSVALVKSAIERFTEREGEATL